MGDPSILAAAQVSEPFQGSTLASWRALARILFISGAKAPDIHLLRGKLEASYVKYGAEGYSRSVKGWSNAARSVLSRDSIPTHYLAHCRSAKNSVFTVRNTVEFASVPEFLDRNRGITTGIPPTLLMSGFGGWATMTPTFRDFMKVAPLTCIARSSPPGDGELRRIAIRNFKINIQHTRDLKFDTHTLGSSIFRYMGGRIAPTSSWHWNTKASYDYTQSDGGKIAEVIDEVIDGFSGQLLREFVPNRPDYDLVDITGSIFIQPEDWNDTSTVGEVAYPFLREADDKTGKSVIGMIGLLWSIRWHIFEPMCGAVHSCPIAGLWPPGVDRELRFEGTVPARVVDLPEEGFKVRVITITPLATAIIGIVNRKLLDPKTWADDLSAVGLLSGAKLYDVMKAINYIPTTGMYLPASVAKEWGLGIQGLSDNSSSFYLSYAVSADLETATDTPDLHEIHGLLRGVRDSACDMNPRHADFMSAAFSLAMIPRTFEFSDGTTVPPSNHKSGLMMGEALSGFYLNAISLFVRRNLFRFKLTFSDYSGSTVELADQFLVDQQSRVQVFLDSGLDGPHGHSSQSGDDLIYFSNDPDVKRFMILMYRIFKMKPSSSTFYNSESFATFTEEVCCRSPSTHGWVYMDIIKARLLLDYDPSQGGVESLLTRIKVLTSKARYLDDDTVDRLCVAVDSMIDSSRKIDRFLEKHKITKGIPDWLGGLDHPICHRDDFPALIPEVDMRIFSYIMSLPDEELFTLRYSKFNKATEEFSCLHTIWKLFESSEHNPKAEKSDQSLDHLQKKDVLEKVRWMGEAAYHVALKTEAKRLGLVSFPMLASMLTAASSYDEMVVERGETEDQDPLRSIRNRKQFLLSILPEDQVVTSVPSPKTMALLRHHFNRCEDRYIYLDSLRLYAELPIMSSFKVVFTS